MNLDLCKNIFFIGIGGISMSSLSMILKSRGYSVSGYDRSKNDETALLESNGIKISYNIDESLPSAIDAVIFTAAVDESHPLMKAAKIRGIPTFSRAELLGHLGSEYAHSVGVAGTHGKSTTGGMISSICHNSPTCNSTYVIGAVLPFCRSAYKIGSDDKIIYEACEYKNSFLSFFPSVAVILNIELDHTDFFKNIDDMISSFRKYLSNSKSAIINADNENALKTLNGYENPYKTYSIEKNNADYYTKNLVFSHGFPSFDVYENSTFLLSLKLNVPGLHNVSNALAAVAAARQINISASDITTGLNNFCGVARRFEYLCDIKGAKLFDDYAHHPDEIRATLKAAKSLTDGRVIAVFQPHTFSRLKSFFDDFADALSIADLVAVTDVFSAREIDDASISGKMLADKISAGIYIKTFDDIADFIIKNAQKNDVILLLGAGDINKVGQSIKKIQNTY